MLEALLLTIGLAWWKSVPASLCSNVGEAQNFLKIKHTEYASPPTFALKKAVVSKYTSSSGKAKFFKNQIILNQ